MKSNNLNYKKLTGLDIKISVLGLGTEQFSRNWGRKISTKEMKKIFSQFTNQGINHIDTAECYGDHISEKLIGDYTSNKNDLIIKRNKPFKEELLRLTHKVQSSALYNV